MITGTADNDSIVNFGDDVTIDSGSGNDTIYSGLDDKKADRVSINAGEGDNIISIQGGSDSVTIRTGDGNNLIDSISPNNAVFSGAGNDTVMVYNTNNHNHIFQYSSDNDLISGFKENDTLRIVGPALSSSIVSDELTFNTDGGNSSIISGNKTLKVDGDKIFAITFDSDGNIAGLENVKGSSVLITNAGEEDMTMLGGDGDDLLEAGTAINTTGRQRLRHVQRRRELGICLNHRLHQRRRRNLSRATLCRFEYQRLH